MHGAAATPKILCRGLLEQNSHLALLNAQMDLDSRLLCHEPSDDSSFVTLALGYSNWDWDRDWT